MIFRAFLAALVIAAPHAIAEPDGWAEFIRAVGQVESGQDDAAVGDGGKAIGRYQIWRVYWIDATEFDKSIGGRYEDVRDKDYAEKVMRSYFRRYASRAYESGDWQTLARIHNGGPRGHKKAATIGYWEKVQKEMQR